LPRRGGGPADVADLVTFAIFAQAFKIRTRAAQAHQPHLQFDLSTARQIDRMLPGVFEIGIHAHNLMQVSHGPALGHVQYRAVAEIDFSQVSIATFTGNKFLRYPLRGTGRHYQVQPMQAIPGRRRKFVHHNELQIATVWVGHADADARSDLDRQRIVPLTFYA
jgi:hypothetical protein